MPGCGRPSGDGFLPPLVVLLEMKKDGAYPEVLWQFADAMATNAPLAAGKPVTVEESYRDALGCQRLGASRAD
jgi:hypothetical protein